MAISYLELAKVLPNGDIIEPEGVLVFDEIVSSVGSLIEYNQDSGVITFHEPGYYYFDWYVAPQFGLTTDGSNWAIQKNNGELSIIGSSHTRVSVTTGFAMINAAAEDTVRLVNVSDGALTLSQAVRCKAGLIVFSVAVMNYAP